MLCDLRNITYYKPHLFSYKLPKFLLLNGDISLKKNFAVQKDYTEKLAKKHYHPRRKHAKMARKERPTCIKQLSKNLTTPNNIQGIKNQHTKS